MSTAQIDSSSRLASGSGLSGLSILLTALAISLAVVAFASWGDGHPSHPAIVGSALTAGASIVVGLLARARSQRHRALVSLSVIGALAVGVLWLFIYGSLYLLGTG